MVRKKVSKRTKVNTKHAMHFLGRSSAVTVGAHSSAGNTISLKEITLLGAVASTSKTRRNVQ